MKEQKKALKAGTELGGAPVWEVVCDPYPRIIVEAADEGAAIQHYRDRFSLRRPELPVRAKRLEEAGCP